MACSLTPSFGLFPYDLSLVYFNIKVITRVLYSFDGVGNFYFVEKYSSCWGGGVGLFFCDCLIYIHLEFIISTTLADGGWSSWEAWSSCSVSCGVGVQSRSRKCSNPAPYGGGKDCSGNSIESSTCDAGICVGECSVVFKAIN